MSAQVLLGEILHGGVGGMMATDPSFYYDPVTQTLYVPAISSASQTFEGETTVDFTTTGNTIIGDTSGDTLTVNATTSILAVATFGTSVKLQFRNTTTYLRSSADGTLDLVGTTVAITATTTTVSGILTVTGATTHTGAVAVNNTVTVTSTSASALTVGANGATNPVLKVNANTASVATGLSITGAAAAGGLALAVISSGTDENLTINAKGAGTITIGSVSTGIVTITPATTITGALTNTGAFYANGGVDRSTAAALAIGATNATSVVITPATTITGALTLTAGIAAKHIMTSTETIAAGGTTTALDLTKYAHNVDADAGGDIFTLADGIAGQEMFVFLKTATGVATITPATATGFTSVTLNAAGDSVLLKFVTTLGWIIAGGNSYAVV